MKVLKRSTFILITVLAIFELMIILLGFLNHCGLLPVRMPLSGFDYLPPLWLLVLVLPVCVTYFIMKRWRMALGLLLIILSFFLLFDDFSMRFLHYRQPVAHNNYKKLTVITYNVRYYSHGIDKIVNFFTNSNADVILLSESVLDSQRYNYFKDKMTGYQLISDYGHDTAILSRFPILSYDVIYLPSYLASLSGSNDLEILKQKNDHRSFIHAVVNVHGVPVNLLSVRLIAGRAKDKTLAENWKWGRYLLNMQEQEQKVIMDYLATINAPMVFGGDFNAPPSARVIKKFHSIARDAYFADHLYGNFTFRTNFPTMRLDYIFHSPDLIPVDTKIIRIGLSDHFPVKCEFLVPKNQSLVLH